MSWDVALRNEKTQLFFELIVQLAESLSKTALEDRVQNWHRRLGQDAFRTVDQIVARPGWQDRFSPHTSRIVCIKVRVRSIVAAMHYFFYRDDQTRGQGSGTSGTLDRLAAHTFSFQQARLHIKKVTFGTSCATLPALHRLMTIRTHTWSSKSELSLGVLSNFKKIFKSNFSSFRSIWSIIWQLRQGC